MGQADGQPAPPATPEPGGAPLPGAPALRRNSMRREDTALELSALGAAGPSGSGKAAQEGPEVPASAQGRGAAREGDAEPDVEIAVEAAPGALSREAAFACWWRQGGTVHWQAFSEFLFLQRCVVPILLADKAPVQSARPAASPWARAARGRHQACVTTACRGGRCSSEEDDPRPRRWNHAVVVLIAVLLVCAVLGYGIANGCM